MEEQKEIVIEALDTALEMHDENRKALQDELIATCNAFRKAIDEMEERINSELETVFSPEDARLQKALSELRSCDSTDEEVLSSLIQKAKAELLVMKSYSLEKADAKGFPDFSRLYKLGTRTDVVLEHIGKRTIELEPPKIGAKIVSFQFNYLNPDEERVLGGLVKYTVVLKKKGVPGNAKEYVLNRSSGNKFSLSLDELDPATTYLVRVSAIIQGKEIGHSNEVEVAVPWNTDRCSWKSCPYSYFDYSFGYSLDSNNPRVASNTCYYGFNARCCTIIGNTPLPLNTVTSWSIKVLKSYNNNRDGIFIGVAPSGINQNKNDNSSKCGWYFYCYDSTLWSGHPHNYKGRKYGPRKIRGEYVCTEDIVCVVMDTAKGELSFVLNGVNLGVAYEGIPLDKPLVPCVLLRYKNDSVELDTSEVKENMDRSIPFPSNITAKCGTTWDSITLEWKNIKGATFYQIEVDESRSWNASSTNTFTKRGLLPETEHTFRVRAVKGNSVGEWSDVMKVKTQKESFKTSRWKGCPDYVDEKRKYSVDENNPRIATKLYGVDNWCTIIGNTPLPLGKVSSWSIKILKSKNNNGGGILIGVAPSNINQNESDNCYRCGWYFYCYDSTLWSGPPHNYSYPGKEYGPRKENGKYIHNRDSVGVVMDTTKGELSFVLNGVNLGVAYEGIPLGKPLVSCVILKNKCDYVKLDTSEVKGNIDSSIPVLSNIVTKSITWDSITLTWDVVGRVSFYQIEVDGNKSRGTSSTNTFTKRGLLPETEHTFRVRAVRGNSVSEWSDVVKVKTQKAPFISGIWKKCPDNVVKDRKYSVDMKNPRIATKIDDGSYCSIIGNTPLPLNQVISWNIKILKSVYNGAGICIGVAPSDINQNIDNYYKCGWYFYCYDSTLWSGHPHNYKDKVYGPRKGGGEYVHTGDSVGVVIDTTNGKLSFVLNRVNLGVAYKGVPLNKPLVPCVLLKHQDDSVELVV